MKGERVAEGRTAEVFAWGEGQVLKLYRAGWPREEAEREALLAQTVHAGGVRTPAAIDVVAVDGRYGVVFERVEGPTMLAALQASGDQKNFSDEVDAFARMLAEVQADMHSRSNPNLPSQRTLMRRRIAAVKGMTGEARAAVLAALAQLPDGNAFCHGDFHPGNIILTPDGPVIIDWVDVTRGNPLADVARTLLLVRVARPPDARLRSLIELVQRRFRAVYLERYNALRSLPAAELDAWELPVAAARLTEGLEAAENERLMGIINAHVAA